MQKVFNLEDEIPKIEYQHGNKKENVKNFCQNRFFFKMLTFFLKCTIFKFMIRHFQKQIPSN